MTAERELLLEEAASQFIFPFSLKHSDIKKMKPAIEKGGYAYFRLREKELEDRYYGAGRSVSHDQMDLYFLPFIENLLFDPEPGKESLSRFSSRIGSSVQISYGQEGRTYTADVLSADLFICPFQIGILSVRTKLSGTGLTLSDVQDFQNHFRILEPKIAKNKNLKAVSGGREYSSIQEYIFKEVAPCIVPFIETGENESSYFGSLPYFVDERMYVISTLISSGKGVSDEHLFRCGQVNGYDQKGMPYLSAGNPEYIRNYVSDHCYTRWAPETNYIISDHSFTCLTQGGSHAESVYREMYGEHYYSLLLHYFYKMVLLKLSYQYSLMYRKNRTNEIEQLITAITDFSGKYHFKEISSRTEGQELASLMNQVFHISTLYDEVKKTLDSLYRNQEKLAGKRNNYLLFILTTYTVISGIYGMNLVIEDWKGKIDWSMLSDYSLFEYIAFCVAISGILIGFSLGAGAIASLFHNYYVRRKKR